MVKNSRGVTLVEIMVAVAILSLGILGFFGSFQFITKSLHVSRTRTLATNLAQEKIETLKDLNYYNLLITTAAGVDSRFSTPIKYDTVSYPAETISIGGVNFTRYTYVTLANITNNVVTAVAYTFPDTGMKEIVVNVVWTDAGSAKVWTLTNLLENPNVNPLDSSLSGAVTSASGGALAGAEVYTEQNPNWSATADSGGNYSFRVYHGSYTVRASSSGYYDNISSLQIAATGSNTAVPTIALTAIASGTVTGNAWYSPNLVISQVVASSAQASGFTAQYVELYNPTTAPINIGSGGTAAVNLNFDSVYSNMTCSNIPLVYVSTYIPSYGYYVIANTTTFMISGTNYAADAYYSDTADSSCSPSHSGTYWNTSSNPQRKLIAMTDHSGAFRLTDGSGNAVDSVGWRFSASYPSYCEGTCADMYTGSYGFPPGEQLVRISSPAASLSASDMNTYGHAYDSGNNNEDFFYPINPASYGIQFPPRTTSYAAKAPIAGVPDTGAYIAASDPYSGAVQPSSAYISSGSLTLLYAPFALTGVTTGTWTVDVADSSGYYSQVSNVTVTQNVATTLPGGSSGSSVLMTSSTVNGFIKGRIADVNNSPLSNIQVAAAGVTKTTGSNGLYFAAVSSGPITVVANPNNANASYVQGIAQPTIYTGQLTTDNFTLSQGGSVQGYLTTGTTPVPNYVVYATIGGSQYGAGTSDASGNFTIRNLSTGTYTVAPVLDPGQDSSPNSVSATVTTPGTTVSVGTFTVSGALGAISGTVTMSGALVTSGALLVASTGGLPSTPPMIVASSAPALTPIYAVSSKADGTYSLPVRGGNSYNLSVYVPTISGASSVSVTTKTYSGISVTAGGTTTKNITVP